MLRHSAGEKDYSISWKDLCRIETLARPERFELPAYCSGGNRSIQLSYGRASENYTRATIVAVVRLADRSYPNVLQPSLRVLQFHASLVRFEKLSELIGLVEQPDPLFVIEGDRESSQAIHAHAALFADLEFETAPLASLSLFQFRDSGFQFFVTWFGHIDFPQDKYANSPPPT